MLRTHAVVMFLTVVTGLAVASADAKAVKSDAAGDYQSLFGEEEKAVVKQDTQAAAFAAKLFAAAQKVGEQKDLQALLYEKAYEFGMKSPAGYHTALDAMRLLLKAEPENKVALQEKLLKVLQGSYAKSVGSERKLLGQELLDLLLGCADERLAAKQSAEALGLYRKALDVASTEKSPQAGDILEKIKQLTASQESERRFKELRARLEATPKNSALRLELIVAHLGELNTPDEAANLLNSDLDEKLRANVLLAATKVEGLDEAACLELAHWYMEIKEKASSAGKMVLLGKAKACSERYLSLHAAQDGARLKGQMLLAEVEKVMEKSGPRSPKNFTLDPGGVAMKLTLIPAGRFMMGSPAEEKDRSKCEGPQHEVTISKSFYVGVFKVTHGQFAAFVSATGYKTDAEKEGWATAMEGGKLDKVRGASWKNPGFRQTDDNPVVCASYGDATAFCAWLSRKTGRSVLLPTEAQWEYVCRAGGKTRWNCGDSDLKLGDYAWYALNSDKKTHPVGLKKPNAWGVYDMHGNAWEWCSDWYADSYANAAQTDPAGPASGAARVIRGGAWLNESIYFRSAFRYSIVPGGRSSSLGLRVIVDTK